jgi:bifunctional oligoribonuclease and PAP phosphatase NrnA
MGNALDHASTHAQLREVLASPRRVVIVTHHNPDGDAIGSSLGLKHLLSAAGHSAAVVLPNAAPSFLSGLPGVGDAICFDKEPERAKAELERAEWLFCLDFNRMDRVGNALQVELAGRALPRVLIDHHQDPDPTFTIALSDTGACATCQLVADLIAPLGWSALLNKEVATCLYTGLVTDSGSFRFRSTTAHTMRVAALLMEHGVEIERVHQSISDDNSEERLRLLGLLLSERMTVMAEHGVVLLSLSKEDLERHGHRPGDTEGFVNYGLSMRGMRLSAFFVERHDHVKLSLRSKGTFAVDRFLRDHFDGGGHANAAGGQFKGDLHAAMERFRSLLPELLAQHAA